MCIQVFLFIVDPDLKFFLDRLTIQIFSRFIFFRYFASTLFLELQKVETGNVVSGFNKKARLWAAPQYCL